MDLDACNRFEALLERIAISLEKLASKPETEIRGPSEPNTKIIQASIAKQNKKDSFRDAIGGEIHKLIRIYIEAYQGRYGKNARPDVGGKVQGLMKNLLKDHPTNRLAVLIVAFLQMDDPWFKTKNHDFPTLYENLGKIQTAFRNGTPRAEDKSYWDKVFGTEPTIEVGDAKVLGKGSEERRLLGVGRGD